MNLVFVHGAGGSSRIWHLQERHFSPMYPVTLIDLPGHGKRTGRGADSIDEYVGIVREDIHSLDDVVLMGHSMGGAIAMTYALRYPLKACVLAGTGARLRVLPAILAQVRENYEATVDLVLEYALHQKGEQLLRQSREEMLKAAPEVTYRDFVACDTFDMMGEIEKVCVPTLVVCGAQDVMTPVKYSHYLAQHMPVSKLEVIRDCGHMLMIEKPQEFNKILEEFLKRLE